MDAIKSKNSDISRPLNQSFRHTGHGSVLGASWGNPTFIEPGYLAEGSTSGSVELRGHNSPNMKDRKKKCVSEQYVRERKSNANKQFAYNKLKNEKHIGVSRNDHMKSSPPQRPPQPKIVNNEKEGMLIDLSPPALPEANSNIPNGNGHILTPGAASILDTPIDIPTEDGANGDSGLEFAALSNEAGKPEPPPYQSPPTYINTYGLSQQPPSVFSDGSHAGRAKAADPFDTSHLGENAIYANHAIVSGGHGAPSPLDSAYSAEIAQQFSKNASKYGYSYEAMMPEHRQSHLNSQFDDLVQNTLASLSPKSIRNQPNVAGEKKLNVSPWPNEPIPDQLNPTIDTSESRANESLNDSMKVNLSSLTLNDVDDEHTSKNSSHNSSAIKKFDKDFLAELEKEIYKNDASASSLIANTSQTYSNQRNSKENSVSAIPNEIFARTNNTSHTLNRLHNATSIGSPNKMQNISHQELDSLKRNYNTSSPTGARQYASQPLQSSNSLTPSKKLNFDSQRMVNSDDMSESSSAANQRWMDAQVQKNSVAAPEATPVATPIYGNSNVSQKNYGNFGVERNHNFVAVSNRPPPNQSAAPSSVYSKVPNDLYGSLASGNVYDVVANSAAGSTYYGMAPGASDYYEPILPTESVIYDEVAGEELLRPHRPAPLAPPVLSAQQIQRRMERAQKQMYGNVGGIADQESIYNNVLASGGIAESNQQKIYTLMQEMGGDGDITEHEAAQALQLTNWEHASAVRHIKVERLLK